MQWWPGALILLVFCVALFAVVDMSNKAALKPALSHATTSGVTFTEIVTAGWPIQYDDTPDKPITDGKVLAEFDYALAEWRNALGRKIKRPALRQGGARCHDVATTLACADMENYAVVLLRDKDVSLKTVFMHEIGHLLGVPHIENDPLMDAVYQGSTATPSRYAVVIAKLNASLPASRPTSQAPAKPPASGGVSAGPSRHGSAPR